MRKQLVAVAAATFTVLAAPMASAGSAAADDAAVGATNPPPWVMPTTKGEVLQTAVNDVQSVVGDAELKITFYPVHENQVVYNLTNWAVCATAPTAGKEISQKTKKITFAIRRLNEKC